MNYAEIHFHLLPGIDDGPSSMEETVALAAAAAAEGTRTIVATPHVHPMFETDVRTLPERVREVRSGLAAERIPIQVVCGAEVAHTMAPGLSDAELEIVAHGPPGRRWVLLEAPLTGLDDSYPVVADEVRARGYAVVVAHPERALGRAPGAAEAGWRAIEHEIAAGSALQINAWSIAGLYGERIRAAALALLRRAPQAVIASDAHGGERMPALGMALDALASAAVRDPARFAGAAPHELLARGLAVGRDALAA